MSNNNYNIDISQWAREAHRIGLILPSPLKPSNNRQRCGTVRHPDLKNGSYSYKIIGDDNVFIGKNFETGVTLVLHSGTRPRTKKDREKARELERELEAAEKRIQTIAKEKAQAEHEAENPATGQEPYLVGKGIGAYPGVTALSDGSIRIPACNIDNEFYTVQTVSPDGGKCFYPDAPAADAFYSFPAREGVDPNVILIGEGFATAASAHEATGYSTLAALSASNIENVARAVRDRFPSAELVFLADNDNACADNDNTGCLAAYHAAVNYGGVFAVPPAEDGCSADVNDLYLQKNGPEKVKELIENVRKTLRYSNLPAGFEIIPQGKNAGLYYTLPPKSELDPGERHRLGAPLLPDAFSRTEGSINWGVQVSWLDPDENAHSTIIPMAELGKDRSDWYSNLLAGGWCGDPRYKQEVLMFLCMLERNLARVRMAEQVGWYKDHPLYVLPDRNIGIPPAGEDIRLQASAAHSAKYAVSGTLDDWKQNVAGLAPGNPTLVFALCMPLVGPILNLAQMGSVGFHYRGWTSSGKSSAAELASSIDGSPVNIKITWNATINGLEGIAAAHNDGFLFSDEIGEGKVEHVDTMIYMIFNDTGKMRADKLGNPRECKIWRLCLLSTGEKSLKTLLTQCNKNYMGGLAVRLLEIPVEATDIQSLHGLPDSRTLVDQIKTRTLKYYGSAGQAFREQLVLNYSQLKQSLGSEIETAANRLCEDYPDCDPQVRRAAKSFAVASVAGRLASEWDILPISTDEIWETCQAMFKRWIDARGGIENTEKSNIIESVRFYVEKYGADRFLACSSHEKLKTIILEDGTEAQFPTNIYELTGEYEHSRTPAQSAGYRYMGRDACVYYCTPAVFEKEIIKGYDKKKANEILRKAGILLCGEADRPTNKISDSNRSRMPYYVLSGAKLRDIELEKSNLKLVKPRSEPDPAPEEEPISDPMEPEDDPVMNPYSSDSSDEALAGSTVSFSF